MTKPIPTAGADAPRAYRAIFFDLDGTLLPMELEEFLSTYFKSIASFVAAHEVDPQAFSAGLKAGIGAMAAHDDGRTNHEAYWEAFFQKVDRTAADWDALLGEFYDVDFAHIGGRRARRTRPPRAPWTRWLQKGYPLVLATMPMFPRRAVECAAWPGRAWTRRPVRAHHHATRTATSVEAAGRPTAPRCLAAVGAGRGRTCSWWATTPWRTSGGRRIWAPTGTWSPTTCWIRSGTGLAGMRHGSMADFAAWAEALPACANPADGHRAWTSFPRQRKRAAALARDTRAWFRTTRRTPNAKPRWWPDAVQRARAAGGTSARSRRKP